MRVKRIFDFCVLPLVTPHLATPPQVAPKRIYTVSDKQTPAAEELLSGAL